MDVKKGYAILQRGTWLGLGLMVLALILKTIWVAVAGFLVLMGTMAYTMLFYRCPHCRKRLSTRGKRPERCPHCGRELDQ